MYLLCIASFDWPFKYHWPIILHDTFVHMYLLHCQSDRKPRNFLLERRKKGKWLSSLSLWAPTQVAVRLILPLLIIMKEIQEKKEGIWLSPMKTWQHKNATKNFDCTTISDILRTSQLEKRQLPNWCGKLVYGIPTFPSKRIKTKPQFFCSSVYHDLPASALVLITVANFKDLLLELVKIWP